MQVSKRGSGKGLVLAIFMMGLLTLCSTSAYGATIYVPDKYPTIQLGIDAAVAGDVVIVRDNTYLLKAALDFKGKAITVKSEHGAGKCILDGQKKTRVVSFHSGEGSHSILSGFTIRNGKAVKGGGIYCNGASPTIKDCTITANKAYTKGPDYRDSYGGGIYCYAASPTITNCMIKGNSAEAHSDTYTASSYGGGIYCDSGSPAISNCVVTDNTAVSTGYFSSNSYGGGIYSVLSTPSIANSTISNNATSGSSSSAGGGMYFLSSDPSMVNCIVNGNTATAGAGIFFNQSSSFTSLTNCTVVRNTAGSLGGGFHCLTSSPSIVNSILWENSPDQISKALVSNPTVSHSDVLGDYEGIGNIDANPRFVNIANHDFHLTSTSPCIDVGDNAAPDLPDGDMDGDPRISHKIVDMGAYEFQWEGYSLSGTVTSGGAGVSGVTVNLTGTATKSTTTDANGNYSFSGLSGSYTVTPSKPPCTFAPTSMPVKVNGEDVTGVNFVATCLTTYSISGKVTRDGSGVSGVAVNLTGTAIKSTTTDTNGNYSFSGLANGPYTVTPNKSGLSFNPQDRSVDVNGANLTGIDFAAFSSGGDQLFAGFGASGLWFYNNAVWTQISSLNPEAMLYASGISRLYADFGASGLWQWHDNTWTNLSPVNPENMVLAGSTLYVDFGVSGLWRYSGTTWTQLSPANPQIMVVSGTVLYVGFGADGLWKWDGSAWTQLSVVNPESLWVDGSVLYGSFGAAYGLWKWDGSAWTQLSPVDPENLWIAGSVIYVDFGVYGLWKFEGGAWTQLSMANAENLVISGSVIYVDFGVVGLWKLSGATWSQLDARDPENMVLVGSVLYVDFGADGLWTFSGSTGTRIDARNPQNMWPSASVLYVDFGGYGLYKWNGATMTQLNSRDPEILLVVQTL
jgi:hypothetical protein